MDLESALVWIISGGGAAWFGFYLCDHVPALQKLVGDYKRYVAFALTALVAIGAWCGLTAVTQGAWPADWRAWVSELFSVAATAIIAGQGIHAATTLAVYRREG